ncbi:protein tyrosine phosphatase family protein [Parasphingopyxis marina]|uniref:Protein tyrosine phosphatase family protein n=1 Tax=Parasphingopyxis marina TaxID=2761622 RepID=A0A842HUD3_9SPHN|nr:protein tyrosine phosphatase family protein [Parasphingopyxis marina]MBC2776143.1 protein tyrosine phosphatase family protein [Parasphingopyxis marina]
MLDEAGIYNFRRLSPELTTSGQPSPDQLRLLGEAGVETVINLAMPDSPHAVPEEAEILGGLGIAYIAIPVDFAAPGEDDFLAFREAMDALGGGTAHVHCIANYRVSAFLHRYRKVRPDWAGEDPADPLPGDWEPDAVWREFMNRG